MIPQAVLKFILPKVLDHVIKVFKLDKVLKYVEDENELDIKIKEIEKRIEKLESWKL